MCQLSYVKKMIILYSMKEIEYNSSKIFAARISELRKEKHMTQEELAKKIGMKRGVIGYYEASAKNPTIDTVKRFADFFNVSISELIEEPTPETAKPGPIPKLHRQMSKIKRLSPARQKMISKAIDVLIDG